MMLTSITSAFTRRAILSTAVAASFRMTSSEANAAESVVTGGKPRMGEESLMSQKAHGTTASPVQQDLRWGVSRETADRICSFNRHYAEYSGYFKSSGVNFLSQIKRDGETVYYDSVSGKPLFVAPRGRSVDDFLKESAVHGWPSFRDEEVVWENMRVLKDGESVSVDGTHLGHNIPDFKGNRYCINLVSVAGKPPGSTSADEL